MEQNAGVAVEIRSMKKEDLPALAELYRQFWNEPSDLLSIERQFRRISQNSSYILLSAVLCGCLVGSVMGILCEDLYGDGQPFLVVENMIVDRESRRAGIGSALLHRLEVLAREQGCTQILLVTEKFRQDACGFYEANGFSQSHAGYKKKL